VVFLPGHRYIGVPASGGSYRWVRLRPLQIQAYDQLGRSVPPFPQRRLAGLDQSFVSRAKSDGTRTTVGGDTEGGAVPPFPIVGLVALGLIAGVGITRVARQRRRAETAGIPNSGSQLARCRQRGPVMDALRLGEQRQSRWRCQTQWFGHCRRTRHVRSGLSVVGYRPKLTAIGSRSPPSSILKNSRGRNPPCLAMIELGKTWIFVL
jgi:hypothetical protein